MAGRTNAKKDPIMVKDLILDDEEMDRLNNSRKKNGRSAKYTAVMQNGCDFAIERRDTGSQKTTRLVILVSQSQFYIESGKKRQALTRSLLRTFLSGLKKGESVMLPDVNWIGHIENEKSFCSDLMNIIQELLVTKDYPVKRENKRSLRKEMICQGLFLFDGENGVFDKEFAEKRFTRSDYNYVYDFSPYEDYHTIMNRFGNPENTKGIEKVRLFGGYNPPGDNVIDMYDCAASVYDHYQLAMYAMSSPLYKYMIKMMSCRRGVTYKELLQDMIPDCATKESLLFQSFPAFVLIGTAFGIEQAKKAMERYMDSDIRDIIPVSRMGTLLYNTGSAFRELLFRTPCWELKGMEEGKPLHGFAAGRFIDYLIDDSVKQGYERDMGLFLYHWGQFIFLQEMLDTKKKEKYPAYLASRNVELMSRAYGYSSRIEEIVWKEVQDFARPLEYVGDSYQIVIPHSMKDLIKEAEQQCNCVRTYETSVLNRMTRIVFMRLADPAKQDRSLVTIEVDNDGNVIQCKGRFNENPSIDQWRFILEWEKAKTLNDRTYAIPEELRIEKGITMPNRPDPFDVL